MEQLAPLDKQSRTLVIPPEISLLTWDKPQAIWHRMWDKRWPQEPQDLEPQEPTDTVLQVALEVALGPLE
jgi:hypothetical protein